MTERRERQIHTYVSPSELAMIDELAGHYGQSRAGLIRMLVWQEWSRLNPGPNKRVATAVIAGEGE